MSLCGTILLFFHLFLQDDASPLFIASQEGHSEIVDLLVKVAEINVNKVSKVRTVHVSM